MAKNKIKNPGDLQVDDQFYMIVSAPVDDHKRFQKSELKYFAIKDFTVDGIKRDPRNPDLRIIESNSEEYSAPKIGYNGRYNEDSVIADKDKAKELCIKWNHEQYQQAQADLEELNQQIGFLAEVMKRYDPELKVLSDKEHVVFSVEEAEDNAENV